MADVLENIEMLQARQNFTAGEDIELDAIEDVPVEVTVVLGETNISVENLLKLGKGAVVQLDRKIGEPVELYVNERCVAKGEIVVVDNKIGITMTEIIKNDKE
jgi:flagellar motor switch protein FliN/FliY